MLSSYLELNRLLDAGHGAMSPSFEQGAALCGICTKLHGGFSVSDERTFYLPQAGRARRGVHLGEQQSTKNARPCIKLLHMGEPTSSELQADTSESLMQRYQAGDASAFDVLYARHRGGLFRFIQRQCRSNGECEEVFQEVWINVIQSRATYGTASGAQFNTWLYTLAHHRLMDYFRKHRVVDVSSFSAVNQVENNAENTIPASRVDEPQVLAESREQGAAILRLLDALPAPQREAFLLYEEGGLSIEDIAVATGVTFEAAKSRLRYAFAKLRDGLQEYA